MWMSFMLRSLRGSVVEGHEDVAEGLVRAGCIALADRRPLLAAEAAEDAHRAGEVDVTQGIGGLAALGARVDDRVAVDLADRVDAHCLVPVRQRRGGRQRGKDQLA